MDNTSTPNQSFLFLDLAEELLLNVLADLPPKEQCAFARVSKKCHRLVTPLIWKHVELVDCRVDTNPTTGHRLVTRGPATAKHRGRNIPAGTQLSSDEHDDTPLIKILLVLATNPTIAASVESVTHRCHLTSPDIFLELPNRPFTAQTLSADPRTICLVRLAVRNMTRVNTLRLVFGHPKLTEALLRCFFDADRRAENRVKRLWLDNIGIVAGLEKLSTMNKYGLPLNLDFRGVETLRLRRLRLEAMEADYQQRLIRRSEVVYSRGGRVGEMSDGLGGNYLTTISHAGAETVPGLEQAELADEAIGPSQQSSPLETLMRSANRFDDAIYAMLSQQYTFPSEVVDANIASHYWRSLHTYMDRWTEPVNQTTEQNRAFAQLFRTDMPTPTECARLMLTDMASTLTSLNIDWAITAPTYDSGMTQVSYTKWIRWYADLFSLRFPHLRAFQYRNAITEYTLLPPGLYLLDHASIFTGNWFEQAAVNGDMRPEFTIALKPLEFMEAHADQLQCLAWPMELFFSPEYNPDIAPRVRSVVDKLSWSLVDLRVDYWYARYPEPQSEENAVDLSIGKQEAHRSRRRFITEFAAEMRVLRSIKVEGGIPRDERRETIAALRHCTIEKLVFIGIGSIIGNTWGVNGENYWDEMIIDDADLAGLEEEDEAGISLLGPQPPSEIRLESTFTPSYGWHGREPMLHTIVSHHGSTLRELKMCGYKGAIVLHNPSPIVTPMLAALQHCHALESLILSFWLPTIFEHDTRDAEIIAYWLNQRDTSSTALVVLSSEPPAKGSWAYELETKYKPEVLASTVARLLGPHLSSTAKQRRPGGIYVRASFCLDHGAIFDLDLWIGENLDGENLDGENLDGEDGLVRWRGPNEETEPRRRREKLEARRWF